MDIVIREATLGDAIFLTSILMSAKKYRFEIEEFWNEEDKEFIITKEYLKNNKVFIVEKQSTIIGCCALHKVKQAYSKDEVVVEPGYWLKYLFIRPAYTHVGIGSKLIEKLITYCKENQIVEFNVLSSPKVSGFYSKLGAAYIQEVSSHISNKRWDLFRFKALGEHADATKDHFMAYDNQTVVRSDMKAYKGTFVTSSLEQKLFELDKDAEEDELYDDDQLYEDELYEDELYKDELYDDEDYDTEEYDVDRVYSKNEPYEGQYKRKIWDINATSDEVIDNTDELYRENQFTVDKNIHVKDELISEDKMQEEPKDAKQPYEKRRLMNEGRFSEEKVLNNEDKMDKQDKIEEKIVDNREIGDKEKLVTKEDTYEEGLQEDNVSKQNAVHNDKTEEAEIKEKLVCRLSYDEFEKAAVPIGYKFECEEIEEQSIQNQSINYEAIVDQIDDQGKIAEAAVVHSIGDYTRSEKEKMLEGEMYIAWGDEIVQDRQRARKLLKEFNNADPDDRRLTRTILNKLFGKLGEYIHIEPDFKCSYGYNIEVGENFYASYNCVILDHAKVSIGDNCIISPQVGIYTLGYPLNAKRRIAGYEYAKPVTIGDNVWIGGGAIINPGVSIGNNVVISPGAVIVSDIPDNVLVGGNPAKVMNRISI